MSAQIEPDMYEGGVITRRAEIPPMRCPADKYTHQRDYWDLNNDEDPVSSYDDVGLSYHYNFHSIYPNPFGDVLWNGKPPGYYNRPGDWNDLGREMTRRVYEKHAGTFVMFIEDSMDFALRDLVSMPGAHGKFNKHPLGFLDGHAEYAYADTRKWCGPGWATIVPSWVETWTYKVYGPCKYSDPQHVNCDPPKK
jgi:hypothetical protein